MSFDYDNPGDVFDSREVQDRIDELESDFDEFLQAIESLDTKDSLGREEIGAALRLMGKEDEYIELVALRCIEDYVYSQEWSHGITFVARSHFTQYCREMVADLEGVAGFPSYVVVDWEETANNLEQDYSSIDINGAEYLYRD